MPTLNNSNPIEAADAAEALIAFIDAAPAAPEISGWMRRYPASSFDFARAAAPQWAGEPLGVDRPLGNSDSSGAEVARTRTLAAESLRAFRAARTGAMATVAVTAAARAPLASFVAAAKERDMTPIALADAVRVPYALLFKLHRRLIAPDSVPMSCVNALADALNRPADEIAAYLRQPPTLATGASYRADSAPTTGEQESFADALDADGETTDAHRAFHGGEIGRG